MLKDASRQILAISVAEADATRRMGEYRRYISTLDDAGRLDREIEFIPEDEELVERKANGSALTRPEISLLLSYTKAILKEELCNDETSNGDTLAGAVESAFPQELRGRFSDSIYAHRLKREIVATQLANEIVNRMGFTFVYRMHESTGATSPESNSDTRCRISNTPLGAEPMMPCFDTSHSGGFSRVHSRLISGLPFVG